MNIEKLRELLEKYKVCVENDIDFNEFLQFNNLIDEFIKENGK